MNIQHLIYFRQAAKYNSISKAAQALFVDTSTISKAITGLEEDLDVPLFNKSGRNIVLTRFGKVFYQHVNMGIQQIEKGNDLVQAMSDTTTGNVKIDTMYSIASYYLPTILKGFQKKYPDISVDLAQSPSGGVTESVIEGSADLGICGDYPVQKNYPNLSYEKLFNEEVQLVVSTEHPLAANDSVSFNEIKDEIFIGYSQNTSIAQAINRAIEPLVSDDFEFKTIYNCNEDNSVASLVRKNLGIAFVCNIPTMLMDGLKVIEVTDIYIIRDIYLIWNNESVTTAATKALRTFILSCELDLEDFIRYSTTPDVPWVE